MPSDLGPGDRVTTAVERECLFWAGWLAGVLTVLLSVGVPFVLLDKAFGVR